MFGLLFGRKWLLGDRSRFGRWGERTSYRYLRGKGLRLVCRNYSCRGGEIDIVMADGCGGLVFVEVKTRSSEEMADAEDAVDFPKRQKLIRAARYFLSKYGDAERSCRFDVVAVVLGESGPVEIRHYENAFVP